MVEGKYESNNREKISLGEARKTSKEDQNTEKINGKNYGSGKDEDINKEGYRSTPNHKLERKSSK